MWTTLWQHLSHRLLYAAGFSPFWPAGASWAPLGWEGSQALQIHSDWRTDQSSFCNDLQKCFWGSEDLVGLERPGCNLQSQAVDLEGLHGSCLRRLPPPSTAPSRAPAFRYAHKTLLLCTETRRRGALVVPPLLAMCSLAQICMRARGKGDLGLPLPSPNVLFLTPLHALPEVSVRFGESLCSQRTNRNRSKRQLSERQKRDE